MQFDPAVPASAVVVNCNGREHLELCLTSLLRQSLPGIEVLLVDNHSTDGSVEFVRQRFGDAVRVLALSSSRGYAHGINAGIQAARGRYIFPLNNDTEVAAGCVAALVAAAQRLPQVGSFAPKILSFYERDVIDNVGHLFYPDGLSRGRGRLERDHGQYDREEEILLASGCALLLRREMLADIGLFDEDFFAYCEDTDFGLRAQLAGWKCWSVPDAVVYHKYSSFWSGNLPMKAFLVERNRTWVAVKCFPLPLLLLSPLFTLLRLAAQAWGVLGRRGAAGTFAEKHSPRELLGVLARATAAALRGLPAAWRKRRRVQHTRRISTAATFRWITRYGMGPLEIALKD